MQSKELTCFYQAYLDWLENGCKPNSVFHTGFGLCRCLVDYLIKVRDYSRNQAWYVKKEMQDQFQEAGLDSLFPFSNGMRVPYIEESENFRMHLNPRRIQWVKEHATPSSFSKEFSHSMNQRAKDETQ